jgi:hypothetical protein
MGFIDSLNDQPATYFQMDKILYYPFINLPQSDWSIRSLLYYDAIGTIVPERLKRSAGDYEPFMQELVKNKLVEPINPVTALSSFWEVSETFVRYIESDDFDMEERRRQFRRNNIGKIHEGKFSDKSAIHADKFDRDLFYKLEKAGLAKKNDDDWYLVEKKTADEMMTFLASVIGVSLNYLPTSDKIKRRSYSATGLKRRDLNVFKSEHGKRGLILEEMMPIPTEIDITKLRKFKDKYRDLLAAFRNRVEGLVLDSTLDIESDLFGEKIRELKLRKNELGAKMNENKLGVGAVSIAGVAGAVPGLVANDPVLLGLGIIGLTGAIAAAIQIEKPEHVFDNSGLKYLALADRQLRRK